MFAAVVLVTGCVSTGNDPGDYQPAFTPVVIPEKPVDGAIYQAGQELMLFEDVKARKVGDILTIVLVEQTSGENSSDNNLNKSTDLNIDPPDVGGRERPNFGVGLGADRTFAGGSTSSQSNSLSGSITVTVTGVLPGGNLVVQGEKWIEINQGREYVRLSGVVRPRDVSTTNRVLSTQVADARITYSGTGANGDANKPGWASRILFSNIWPF